MAILGVLAAHAAVPWASGGGRGVDVFFVLSGYLITSLLKRELEDTGDIQVGRFLWRRFLRLAPALLLFLATYVAIAPWLFPGHKAWIDALIAGAYLMDYALLWGLVTPIFHTWSLAIEEQFYLAWPLVVPFLVRLKSPVRTLGFAWLTITVGRAVIVAATHRPYDAYFSLHAHSSGLILGAMLAFARSPPTRFGWLGLACTLGFMAYGGPNDGGAFATIVLIPAAEIAAAAMIAGIAASPSLNAVLAWRPLMSLGLISYGVYLWHPLVFYALRKPAWGIAFPAVTAISILLATVSFLTVEKFARRFRGPEQLTVRDRMIRRGAR